jgi:predicted nucleic acid-binding protein
VTDAWVINASPIILYGRIGRIDVIERLAPSVIVPTAVIEEIRKGVHKDNTAKQAITWAEQYKHPNIEIPSSIERWDLGQGESQVVSMSLQGKRWAVLDDRMARRCVNAHGLQMTGSLGIILRAKNSGIIKAARPWVYKLKDEGMYVDVDLVERVLSAIGEGK